MTVAELIAVLQGYNPSLRVFVDDWDDFEVNTGEDDDGECLVIEQP